MSQRYSRSSRLYHRLESPTQTPQDAVKQVKSGEIWGRPAKDSFIPKVKAYRHHLPVGKRGVEFSTTTLPDPGTAPYRAEWSGPRPGVRVENGFAKIQVRVIKNTQT